MLANHFHLRLMTMLMKIFNGYKRLHFSDPLNGVSKQNLVKTSLSKIYSTTKETHQLLLRAYLESRIKKWKYIYTMCLNNQYCINTLNIVTVLLKSVHAVRKCLDNGSFSKLTSLHWRMNISFSSKSVHLC